MKNKIHKYDFLIIGGGLIGTLTGLALYKKKFKVLVIEKNKQLPTDKRTLAVNANSKDFLDSLNLWKDLNREAIEQIVIQDQINQSHLDFENKKEPMGYVVFNKELMINARQQLNKNHILIEGVTLDIENLQEGNTVKIKDKTYLFNKIILSVGRNFKLTTKIKKNEFHSNHQSFVGFFTHEKYHQNKAYEFFTKQGPLAVLPIPSKNKKTSTFIYSTKDSVNKIQIKNLINKFFKNSHGKIKLSSDVYSFSIKPHMSSSRDQQFLLLGDSLRSIHPVAGQGWNLGIKDIQTLCRTLDQYSLSDKNFSFIFHSKRKIESISYLSFTNLINYLYEKDSVYHKQIIRLGFQGLRLIKPLKKAFISQAMGRSNLI